MKKLISLICTIVLVLSMNIIPFANATYNINKEPFKFVTNKDTEKKNFKEKKDIIYIKRTIGVVDSNSGRGHLINDPKHEMWYDTLRYKGKRLPIGTKVRTFYISNPLDVDGEGIDFYIARFDLARVKVKTKTKIKSGKDKGKYKYIYPYKWITVYCNGFGYNNYLFGEE